MDHDQPAPGLYEEIITAQLAHILKQLDTSLLETESLDPGDSHSLLAQYLGKLMSGMLGRVTGSGKVQKQIEICNRVVALIESLGIESHGAEIAAEASRLLAVYPPGRPGDLPRPETPLARGCLLTGTRLDPTLLSQLRREIASADRVDILCSFIKWSGIRVLEDSLRQFTARPGSRLRVITTSYMGLHFLKISGRRP